MLGVSEEYFEQKIVYARASLWIPFYTVGMVARITGKVPVKLVEDSLKKLFILYPPLVSRIRLESDGSAWLTTKNVDKPSLEIRKKTSDEDWANLFLEQERIPFPFEKGPVTRFFLLSGEESSDLVSIVPHVVCDGYSMTLVMNDAVAIINNPNMEVTQPDLPPSVTWKTIPHAFSDQFFLRGLIRTLNLTWSSSKKILRQQEYEEAHQFYWQHQETDLLSFMLTAEQTSDLSKRCKNKGVSVTGALVAAFIMAQNEICPGTLPAKREISVAVNLRDRMSQQPGHTMGIYASSIDIAIRSNPNLTYWELAKDGHKKIHRAMKNRSKILMPMVLDEMNPAILDGFVLAMAKDQWTDGFEIFNRFVKVRGNMRALNVSNIGRIDLPKCEGAYPLVTLLPFPPLAPGGGMSLNVLTVNGRMNIILKFKPEGIICRPKVIQLKEKALEYLLMS